MVVLMTCEQEFICAPNQAIRYCLLYYQTMTRHQLSLENIQEDRSSEAKRETKKKFSFDMFQRLNKCSSIEIRDLLLP